MHNNFNYLTVSLWRNWVNKNYFPVPNNRAIPNRKGAKILNNNNEQYQIKEEGAFLKITTEGAKYF